MTDDTGHDTSPLQASSDRGTARWSGNALRWSAARAARETGAARSTILEALKSGRLEGTKDADGHWQITPEALGAAGFNPGKPSPPEDDKHRGRGDDGDMVPRRVHELELALADARAEARAQKIRADEMEKAANAYWQLQLEQGESSHAPPESTQADEQAAPIPSHTPDPARPSTGDLTVLEFMKAKRDRRKARRRG